MNVDGVAGSVIGIAGMGIGLGILAHTAKNVVRMSDDMYNRPQRRRRPSPRMDGSKYGLRHGGRGRNQTSICRHQTPSIYRSYW